MPKAREEWEIRVDGGPNELPALLDWFRHDDQLRGRVVPASTDTGIDWMGDIYDVLTVAVGTGGMASALASSLTAWLIHRHSDIKLTLRRSRDGDTTIELDATRVRSPEMLRELRELLTPPAD